MNNHHCQLSRCSEQRNTKASKLVQTVVILPTFDSPLTLELAARSVLNQTLSDLQLAIVVDGGSETTREVTERLLKMDSRVVAHYFPKGSDKGHHWRKLVIEQTEAEMVAYIDDDDLWLPHHLAALTDHAREHNLDVVCSPVLSITPINRTELVLTDHASGKLRSSLSSFRNIYDTHVLHSKFVYQRQAVAKQAFEQATEFPQELFLKFSRDPSISWGHTTVPTALSFHGVAMRAAGISSESRWLQNREWFEKILAGDLDAQSLAKNASVVSHLWLTFTHFSIIGHQNVWDYLRDLAGKTLGQRDVRQRFTWEQLTNEQAHMAEAVFNLQRCVIENLNTPVLTRYEMSQVVESLRDLVRSDRPNMDLATSHYVMDSPWIYASNSET